MGGAAASAGLVALHVGGAAFAAGFSLGIGAVASAAWGLSQRAARGVTGADARSR